jgi:Ca-activated chloride channel family protein
MCGIKPAAVFLAVAAVAGNAQQPPTFKITVQTVVVYATVQEQDGRLVTNLTQDNFTVLDDGKPAAIATFSSADQPITVALLLDMSGSMMTNFLRVRESTLHFIDALLPGDRVRIGSFGSEIFLSPILTGDKAVLARIAREELWPGGGTPLWQAMCAAMDSLQKEEGRRVILTLTDGDAGDPISGWKGDFGEVRRRSTREGFMLYAIGMEGEIQSERGRKRMEELIGETGGGSFIVGVHEDLRQTFTRVANELRHQYAIGITPMIVDGREHRLEVRVDRPGLKARARKSYTAQP